MTGKFFYPFFVGYKFCIICVASGQTETSSAEEQLVRDSPDVRRKCQCIGPKGTKSMIKFGYFLSQWNDMVVLIWRLRLRTSIS